MLFRSPGMVILPNRNLGVQDDKYMTRFEALTDVTAKLCEAAKLGYFVDIDPKASQVVMDVFEGVDRTQGQRSNPRAVFDIENRNLATLQYTDDDTSYKNAFYSTLSGAEFVDEALTLLYYRDDAEQSGFERREKWLQISAQDPPPGQEYDDLKRLAQIEMQSHNTETGFNCELAPNSGYKTLWDIGDFVTIRNRKTGILIDTQITGVTVTTNGRFVSHIAAFGKQPERFIGIGNRAIKI